MTEVYKPAPVDGFELCHPERPEMFETLNDQINGTPRESNWQGISVRLIHEDEGKKLLTSDSPWFGSHALIFRQAAIDAIGAFLCEYGELLPLTCSEAELFVFNPTRVVDALDHGASTVDRFSTGRLMRVTRYAFRANVIADVDIFKIPDLRVSPTFVSRRFVESWISAGLVGLAFTKIWSPGL